VSITASSLMPELLLISRLMVTSDVDGSISYIDLKCPPPVLVSSAKCAFDVPWPKGGGGTVQAQLKSMTARQWDVHSGTPRPFNFDRANALDLGKCVTLDRAYYGSSAINTTGGAAPTRPLVNLVTGVDAFLGAVNVNLTRLGLPTSTVSQLLGVATAGGAGGRALPPSRRLLQDVVTAASLGDSGDYYYYGDGSGTVTAAAAPEEAEGGDVGEEVTVGEGSEGADEAAPAAAASAVRAGAKGAKPGAATPSAAVSVLLPFLHPQKVLSGVPPPGPGARAPLTLCDSDTITWTEQFGGAPAEACGELFNALSVLTLTPNGTAAGAQPPLKFNASLPVVVAGCDLKPSVKLLSLRSSATRGYKWSVSAKAGDKALTAAAGSGAPTVARYTVAYDRAVGLSSYTLEPALLLLNPFAKALPLRGVYATVSAPGAPPVTARLSCKGVAGPNGGILLPAAPSPSAPVPVGCIGAVPLPTGVSGNLTITTDTAAGNVTSAPTPFDLSKGVDEVAQGGDANRCITVAGGFDSGAAAGGAAAATPLLPMTLTAGAPRPNQQLCDSAKFAFNATFGPFSTSPDACGSFAVRTRAGGSGWLWWEVDSSGADLPPLQWSRPASHSHMQALISHLLPSSRFPLPPTPPPHPHARYIAGIVGVPRASVATTPIAVRGCAAPVSATTGGSGVVPAAASAAGTLPTGPVDAVLPEDFKPVMPGPAPAAPAPRGAAPGSPAAGPARTFSFPSRPFGWAFGRPAGGAGAGGAPTGSATSTPVPAAPPAAPQPLPVLALGAVKALNVSRSYVWTVERTLTPQGAPPGLPLALDLDQSALIGHVVSYKRNPAPGFNKEHRVLASINVTNPSDRAPLRLSSVRLVLSRPGGGEVSLPANCGGGVSAGTTLAPRASLRCSVDASVGGDVRPGVVRAAATLADGRTALGAAAAPVSWARAVAVSQGDCATVWDDFTVLSGPPAAAGRPAAALRFVGERPPRRGEPPLKLCGPRDFKSLTQVGPFPTGACGTYKYGGPAAARPANGPQGQAGSGGGELLEVIVGGC
jgi:hypothetical protein